MNQGVRSTVYLANPGLSHFFYTLKCLYSTHKFAYHSIFNQQAHECIHVIYFILVYHMFFGTSHSFCMYHRYFKISETGQRFGFITPLRHIFCESCNRVRLTCTGKLYMCLGQDDNANLAYALRNGGEEKLRETIFEAISRKLA